jgi:hypothetical protein
VSPQSSWSGRVYTAPPPPARNIALHTSTAASTAYVAARRSCARSTIGGHDQQASDTHGDPTYRDGAVSRDGDLMTNRNGITGPRSSSQPATCCTLHPIWESGRGDDRRGCQRRWEAGHRGCHALRSDRDPDPSAAGLADEENTAVTESALHPVPGPDFYFTCSDDPNVCSPGYGSVSIVPDASCLPFGSSHVVTCQRGSVSL